MRKGTVSLVPKFFFLVVLFGYPLITHGQIIQEWVVTTGDPSSDEYAVAMALDDSGNVYVTGSTHYHEGFTLGIDWLTAKYDPDGTPVWIAQFGPGSITRYDEAKDIAVDSEGNVYVTGDSYGSTGNMDITTVKYDPDGSLVWVAYYDGPPSYSDHAIRLVVDGDDNVYVTGWSEMSATYPYDHDCVTIKYDSGGNELWTAVYNGPNSYDDSPSDIAVDCEGNVYVTGSSDGLSNTNPDYFTAKYDTDGNELWTARYDGTGTAPTDDDHTNAITVDTMGNVYVTGTSWWSSPEYGTIVTIKYDSSGNEVWLSAHSDLNGWSDEHEAGMDIEVDEAGNVYVTGWEGYVIQPWWDMDCRIVTFKLDSTGDELWARWYPAGMTSNFQGKVIALDSENNVYVCGHGQNPSLDYLTMKYDTEGNDQWMVWYEGSPLSEDMTVDMVLDNANDIYVTGYSGAYGIPYSFCTIKYSQNIPPISIDLTYLSGSPVPPFGGNLRFNIRIENSGASSITFDAWCMITLPNGTPFGPVLGPVHLTLPSGGSLERERTQAVPAGAPLGTYTYHVYAGVYPDIIWAEDQFGFEKLGTSVGGFVINDWLTWGEELGGGVAGAETSVPDDFALHCAFPNPFNPVTTLSFTVPGAQEVSLTVYDVSGRLVAELFNGWQDAGIQEVTFDGAKLSSGIYFCKLQAGSFSEVKKLVLLK